MATIAQRLPCAGTWYNEGAPYCKSATFCEL
jgi:hypothetical protein